MGLPRCARNDENVSINLIPAKPASFPRRFHFLLLILPALFSRSIHAEWLRDQQDIMGTRITVEVEHENKQMAQQAVNAVMHEMKRIDSGMSPYKPESELSRLNNQAARQPVAVSQEMFKLLQRSIEFSNLTQGAFDITFASAGFLYDYRASTKPNSRDLQLAVDAINYNHIRLMPADHSVRFAKSGVKIDLGGIAKGHAVDNGIRLLQQMDIKNALVTAGGDTRVIGNRWGRPWQIGVRDPRDKNKMAARIPLENVAVSTSGDYERFFEQDGIRYHHIINPKTGDSARELQSVTIIGPDATSTDALSTSIFVMGRERGLQLINRLPDIDAILIDNKGQMHYSAGLEHASHSQ
jgi:thiamine biosynthesis lipoprotein